jgi:hypothetical protein
LDGINIQTANIFAHIKLLSLGSSVIPGLKGFFHDVPWRFLSANDLMN